MASGGQQGMGGWGGQQSFGGNPWTRGYGGQQSFGNKMGGYGSASAMMQPTPYGQQPQRQWGDSAQFNLNPINRVATGANPQMSDGFQVNETPPTGANSQMNYRFQVNEPPPIGAPVMATPENSATLGIRGMAAKEAGSSAQQQQMSDAFNSFQNSMGGKVGQASQPFMPPPQPSNVPSWYNSSMGPAEHYDTQKFPWLNHVTGPNSAPPPQGWNQAAPGSDTYNTIFNPMKGQQLYPNQPWMWPFAGASRSPYSR